MDVVFETSEGRHFTVEIGFFDTVLEMKEMIQKYHGFPVAKQTLLFKGVVMEDDRDTEYYQVLEGSRMHLLTEPDSQEPIEGEKTSVKFSVLIKIPTSKRQISLEVDTSDTVEHVKETIQEMEGVPRSRFVLFVRGIELQDHKALSDYGISEQSEVTVILRPFPPAPAIGNSKKLKLMVLSKCGTKKIPVEVNALDNVSELRKELERQHKQFQFHLPAEGYFFIYKQNVMDDDRTFRWHDVRHGDTIEIFNGCVTGGT